MRLPIGSRSVRIHHHPARAWNRRLARQGSISSCAPVMSYASPANTAAPFIDGLGPECSRQSALGVAAGGCARTSSAG
jgi:hypothetical protein